QLTRSSYVSLYLLELPCRPSVPLFFFHRPPSTVLYTLSLHDALPICDIPLHRATSHKQRLASDLGSVLRAGETTPPLEERFQDRDRKSTRLNSSHVSISYAVFCLKKKNIKNQARASHRQIATGLPSPP